MATLATVKDGLLSLVNGAMQGVTVYDQPITVNSAIDNPPQDAITCVGSSGGNNAIIAITDKKLTTDLPWMPSRLSITDNFCGTALGFDQQFTSATLLLAPGASATIYLGGTPRMGDIIAVTGKVGLQIGCATTTVQQDVNVTSGFTAIAQQIVQAIQDNGRLGAWLTATLDPDPNQNNVIHIQNQSQFRLNLSLRAQNNFTIKNHIKRTQAFIQLSLYASSYLVRDALGDILERLFAHYKMNWGFALDGGGELVRLVSAESIDLDDATVKNVYRRDFVVTIDYCVDETETAYPVMSATQQDTPV